MTRTRGPEKEVLDNRLQWKPDSEDDGWQPEIPLPPWEGDCWVTVLPLRCSDPLGLMAAVIPSSRCSGGALADSLDRHRDHPGPGKLPNPMPRSARSVMDGDQMAKRPAEVIQLSDDQAVAGTELVQDLLEVGRSLRAPLAVSVNTR
jgi:hypothetical protein